MGEMKKLVLLLLCGDTPVDHVAGITSLTNPQRLAINTTFDIGKARWLEVGYGGVGLLGTCRGI